MKILHQENSTHFTIEYDPAAELPEFQNWLRTSPDLQQRCDIHVVTPQETVDLLFLTKDERINFCDGMTYYESLGSQLV
jgi:hypothetical protein